MLRRDFMKAGTALSALSLVGMGAARPAGAAESSNFDSTTVRTLAHQLSQQAYQPPSQTLPAPLRNLNFDQYSSMAFRSEQALWHGENLGFDVEFFPRGYLYAPRIEMNEVIDGQSRPITFNPDMFTYNDPALRVSDDIGFAGLRLRAPINTPGVMEEFCVFLGASYFRAVAKGQNYGLSARGFANGTGDPAGEEFALFRAFWLEKPKAGVDSVVVHALLDSPSLAGAFRFTIRPGETTVFDVQSYLYPRKTLAESGIAPLTGMFYFDANDRARVDDWRPAAHDSEGLLMWTGSSQQLWRPLRNPRDLQFSAFSDVRPHGFGLMQRKRAFTDFEDVALNYEKRPSLWIEPIGDWGAGAVDLVEIPTPNEVNDNIVSFWRPQDGLTAGREYIFTYRMYWGWDTPWPTRLARIAATRVGESTDDSHTRFFDLDFVGAPFDHLPENPHFHLQCRTSAGEIRNVVVEQVPPIHGWRSTFEFAPGDAKVAELNCVLADDNGPVSEEWVYRWTP